MSVLLGEEAFESITIDSVALRAGVSRGTIYSYFPEGREQLIRDAYRRIADQVISTGSAARAELTDLTDRVLALASALASTTATTEGRFYGLVGNATFGPLGGVTGSASGSFHTMLVEDLEHAREQGTLAGQAPVADIAVLLSGAIREIGATTAREPSRASLLLAALRATCDALFHPGSER